MSLQLDQGALEAPVFSSAIKRVAEMSSSPSGVIQGSTKGAW